MTTNGGQMNTIEVRVREIDADISDATPAFDAPWDQLEQARKLFQEWGVTVGDESYSSAWGGIVLEPGRKGRVFFDVLLSND